MVYFRMAKRTGVWKKKEARGLLLDTSEIPAKIMARNQ